MFPKMFYNYPISYLINAVNIATAHRKLAIKIVYSRRMHGLLKILHSRSIISAYTVFRQNGTWFIKIYPAYHKGARLIKSFTLVSTPARAYYVSRQSLFFLAKRSGTGLYLISTSRGIVTHSEALCMGISGFLLGYFFL